MLSSCTCLESVLLMRCFPGICIRWEVVLINVFRFLSHVIRKKDRTVCLQLKGLSRPCIPSGILSIEVPVQDLSSMFAVCRRNATKFNFLMQTILFLTSVFKAQEMHRLDWTARTPKWLRHCWPSEKSWSVCTILYHFRLCWLMKWRLVLPISLFVLKKTSNVAGIL